MARRGRPPRPDDIYRLPVRLAQEDVLFLQELGYDCVREPVGAVAYDPGGVGGRGRKLSMTSVVRALIRVARSLHVDVRGCRTEQDLVDRFVEAIEAGATSGRRLGRTRSPA